jgi:hypothetical protein
VSARQVLAAVVLAALTAGPFLKWQCLAACDHDDRSNAVRTSCHGASTAALRLAAMHECSGHVLEPGVGPARTESMTVPVAMPNAAAADVVVPSARWDVPAVISTAGPLRPSGDPPLRI